MAAAKKHVRSKGTQKGVNAAPNARAETTSRNGSGKSLTTRKTAISPDVATKKSTPAVTKPTASKSSKRPSQPSSTQSLRDSRSKVAPRPKAAAAPTALDPIQFPEEQPKKIKTHLNAKQLDEFKGLLLAKRAELAGDVRRLTSEALHRNDNGSNDHGTMPIHMADLGTDTWEQDFTLGLIANEEALVRDIDEALERIELKTYGICIATQDRITVARLRAKPWAKYCIEYARLREEGRAP